MAILDGATYRSLMAAIKAKHWQQTVGYRLLITREALGRKQAHLAALFGISAQRWHNYEVGARPLDIHIAIDLCNRFNLTLDWLYRGELKTLPYDLAQRIEQMGVNEAGETTLRN